MKGLGPRKGQPVKVRGAGIMRIESSVTSVSWIPSEAITGPTRIPFGLGMTHYDDPPPDKWEDLDSVPVSGRTEAGPIIGS